MKIIAAVVALLVCAFCFGVYLTRKCMPWCISGLSGCPNNLVLRFDLSAGSPSVGANLFWPAVSPASLIFSSSPGSSTIRDVINGLVRNVEHCNGPIRAHVSRWIVVVMRYVHRS